MTTLLWIVWWWFISGLIAWILGAIFDWVFYKIKKIPYDILFISIFLGPIDFIVLFKAMLEYCLDKRKKNKIPENLKECFVFLNDLLSKEDKTVAKKDSKFGIKVHHTLGRTLRNDWYLWRGGKLKNYFNDLGIHHADDMSGIILTSYHRYLNGENIRLNEQVHFYIDYWEKENMKDEEQVDG